MVKEQKAVLKGSIRVKGGGKTGSIIAESRNKQAL